MTDLERLNALKETCPGASAEFLVRQIELKTEPLEAQRAWLAELSAENKMLRSRLTDSRMESSESISVAVFDLPHFTRDLLHGPDLMA